MNERMSRRRILLASACLAAVAGLGTAASPARAQEVRVTQQEQTAVAVTIYNENLALVKDRRRVVLEPGIQSLAFIDVSAQMRPETALLHSQGGQVSVLEQNFEFDLLTPQALLEKYVGEMVTLYVPVGANGEERAVTAKLLSLQGGTVYQIGDSIALTANASDPDGDVLAYTWSATCGRIVGSGANVTFDATGVPEGTCTVTVQASDGFNPPVECTALVINVRARPAP